MTSLIPSILRIGGTGWKLGSMEILGSAMVLGMIGACEIQNQHFGSESRNEPQTPWINSSEKFGGEEGMIFQNDDVSTPTEIADSEKKEKMSTYNKEWRLKNPNYWKEY